MELKKVICDECENEFSLNPADIKKVVVKIDEQDMILAFFMCPKCNKIYRISLYDKRYFELREDLEATKKRIKKNHGNNNLELAGLLNQAVRKKLDRLRAHTDKLNKMFPGTFTLVVSENNHEEKIITYLP